MFQKLIIAGNLGRDPELRTTPSGKNVCSFPVATSRKYKTGDGQAREETVWFRVSVWGAPAEVCAKYLQKGRPVLVEGTLVGDEQGAPRIWEDNEGKSRASFEVNAREVKFLGGGQSEGGQRQGSTPSQSRAPMSAAAGFESDSEMPF